jgi:hypothetical protein
MVDGFRMHRTNHAELVRDCGHMNQCVAEPHARISMLSEIKDRWSDWKFCLSAGHRGQSLSLPNGLRQVFAMMALHLRLRIK